MKDRLKPAGKASLLRLTFSAFLSAALACAVWGQEEQVRFNVSVSVDWLQRQFSAQASYNLSQAGVKLPTGRLMGEEILKNAYPQLLRPYLLSLRVDSDSVIKTVVDNGELSFDDIDSLSIGADKTPLSLSPDLAVMIGRYTIPMEKISALFTRHRQAAEPETPLLPVQTADYTGIIIIADRELPVHGRVSGALLEPCIFPKVWDTNMNLVYEREMSDPGNRESTLVHYALTETVFRPTPSGLEGELADLLGSRPLRIIARGVFGVHPTDPVIDREDALKILSTDNNRRLLREGRVVLVLNEKMLK